MSTLSSTTSHGGFSRERYRGDSNLETQWPFFSKPPATPPFDFLDRAGLAQTGDWLVVHQYILRTAVAIEKCRGRIDA